MFTTEEVKYQINLLFRGVEAPESILPEEEEEFMENLEAAYESKFIDDEIYNRVKKYIIQKNKN